MVRTLPPLINLGYLDFIRQTCSLDIVQPLLACKSSLFATIMPTPPYSKRADNSQSPPTDCSSTKKRRKGATRLSCAECRRQANLTALFERLPYLRLPKVETEV